MTRAGRVVQVQYVLSVDCNAGVFGHGNRITILGNQSY
jgi:hypothetical protein